MVSKILKSFNDLKPTPRIIADTVGRSCMQGVITGRFQSVHELENVANSCGNGAELVRSTSHFRVASSLLRRDG